MTTLAERIALFRRRREIRARWPRPKRYDCNLIVMAERMHRWRRA